VTKRMNANCHSTGMKGDSSEEKPFIILHLHLSSQHNNNNIFLFFEGTFKEKQQYSYYLLLFAQVKVTFHFQF
jgi:hypothetical protein